MIKEIWKDIDGFEGLYQISNLGNVKSIERMYTFFNKLTSRYNTRKVAEKELKQLNRGNGYLCVCLSKNSKHKYIDIHRLVAKAFIPNPNNYATVNHKDKNRHNNNVNNLEWLSLENNVREAMSKEVIQYSKENKIIREWDSIINASNKLNICSSNIGQCCKGKRKTAGGFKWKYRKEVC